MSDNYCEYVLFEEEQKEALINALARNKPLQLEHYYAWACAMPSENNPLLLREVSLENSGRVIARIGGSSLVQEIDPSQYLIQGIYIGFYHSENGKSSLLLGRPAEFVSKVCGALDRIVLVYEKDLRRNRK